MERYYSHPDKVITPEMIDAMATQDCPADEKNKIVVATLCAPVSMVLGSENQIALINFYQEAGDENLQHAQTAMYVQALWEQNWSLIRFYSMMNILQFVLLSFTIVFAPMDYYMLAADAIFSSVMLALEFRQMKAQGWKAYFSDPYNYLDLFSNISIVMTGINRVRLGKDLYRSDLRKLMLIIGVMLLGLRAMSQLRIFKSFRILIELIKQVILDMSYFLAILFIIIFLMSIVQGLYFVDTIAEKSAIRDNLLQNIGDFYLTMMGENPEGEISALRWLIYILFTVLVNIVALNLLIAILSNTYDIVMAQLDATHLKTKVAILDEVSDLLVWNRGANDLQYLHFAYYSFENLTPNKKQNEWEGRVRVMLNEMKEIKNAAKMIREDNELQNQQLYKKNDQQMVQIERIESKLQSEIEDFKEDLLSQFRTLMEEQKKFFNDKAGQL